jgi:hypothetical protein
MKISILTIAASTVLCPLVHAIAGLPRHEIPSVLKFDLEKRSNTDVGASVSLSGQLVWFF